MFYEMSALQKRRTAPLDDRGTVLNIVSWMLAAVVLCTLIARFAMKLSMKTRSRRLGWDDAFIALAALCSFGQTTVVSIEAINVLGQHSDELTDQQNLIYQKTEYAACILYIANMGCARISVCLLINKVLPGRVPRCTALAFAAFTALWTISGLLAISFACSLPRAWNFLRNAHCINVVAFVNYIGITNIIVEVILVMIPLVVWNVRLSAGRQISVSLVFLARLSVVAAIGAQLYFFNDSTLFDPSYDTWAAVLCQQVAQNLAVISACMPYLHPFIRSILAGTVEPETITFDCKKQPFFKHYIGQRINSFDQSSSQVSESSIKPLNEKLEPYCRPLATHGLTRSSTHLRASSFTGFPSITAKPIFDPRPPRDVFNRPVELPQSRPGTSTSAKDPLSGSKELSHVGILPIIDWDTESSRSGGSRRNSPSRQPTAEYIFNRDKVVSIQEEKQLFDHGFKEFAPPLPSPRMPKCPPRAF